MMMRLIALFHIKQANQMFYGFLFLVLSSKMGDQAAWASGQPTTATDDGGAGPIRKTGSGSIQGYIHTLESSGEQVERYLGVPYATPPVGDLRFTNPVPPAKWKNILPTTTLPPACIQEKMESVYIRTHNPEYDGRMSEDCLYLNIYVPHNTSKKRAPLPVLIHVHGGSNMVGMGAMFHGDVLASTGNIIVITFNYRMGSFGFLYMPQLGLMGNYGLFDQNLVFHWVKDNIAAFGGDPGRVTIQGHSAGAVDVGHHVLSPMAKGLFQSAILMSGSPTADWAVTFDSNEEQDERRRRNNLRLLDCADRNKEDTIKCLLTMAAEKLTNTTLEYKKKIYNVSPVVAGKYVVDHPNKMMSRMVKEVDIQPSCKTIMIGVTHDEGSLTADVAVKEILKLPLRTKKKGDVMPPAGMDLWKPLPDHIFSEFKGLKNMVKYIYTPWHNESDPVSKMIEYSNFFNDITFTAPAIKMADGFQGVKDSTVYLYRFSHISANTALPAWMGVPHGEDQFYIFGSPVENQERRNYTQEDVEVSLKVMQLWANFVYDPRNVSIPDKSTSLPRYSSTEHYMDISSKSRAGDIFLEERRLRKQFTSFWNNLVPTLVLKQISSHSERHSDADDTASLWIVTALLCVFFILSLALLICLIFHIRKKRAESDKKHELIGDSGNSIVSWKQDGVVNTS